MSEQTERTTGDDRVADPGGTRPAPKPSGSPGGEGQSGGKPAVQSGDQNDNPRRP